MCWEAAPFLLSPYTLILLNNVTDKNLHTRTCEVFSEKYLQMVLIMLLLDSNHQRRRCQYDLQGEVSDNAANRIYLQTVSVYVRIFLCFDGNREHLSSPSYELQLDIRQAVPRNHAEFVGSCMS